MNGDGITLYLVRHGKAEVGEVDDTRRLTSSGRKTIERVARVLQHAEVHPQRIHHSGLVRARETAEILAGELGGNLLATGGLRPGDRVQPTGEWIMAGDAQRVMLVGHLPFMDRLASYLLTGEDDAEFCHFRTGAVACLTWQQGTWVLEWLLPPALLSL